MSLSASFELREIHTTVVARGNPRATLLNLPQIWSLYHAAGTVEVMLPGERRARIELRDFPLASDEYCRLLSGYYLETLRRVGSQGPSVECVHRGEGRVCWQAGW